MVKNVLPTKLLVTMVMLLMSVQMLFAQGKRITGKVTDEKDGSPLVGVTVRLKEDPNIGTQTAPDGSFSLSVPANGKTLVVSYVGYDTREMPIGNATNLRISLSSGRALEEVVVVGYGTVRKKDLTGSVASVKAKDFNKGIVTSPDQLIQGKVAGVQIINNSGAPGGAATIRIRGNSSVRSGNQPLFVIDGVPLDGRSARPGVNASGLGQTPADNPLNFINPNDIASIDVLKDASATAIYGSRGANGVVIITTKRGQTGAPRIDVNASSGVSSLLKRFNVLTGDQYRAALKAYNLSGGDYGSSVDALGAILRTGISQNYNIAIGGGTENGKYRISAGYLNQEGIVKKSGFKKYTANITGSYKFLDSKKLTIDFNLLASHNTENIAPISNNAGFTGSLISQALQWNPTQPLRNPDGSLNILKGTTTINPLAMSELYDDVSNVSNILASISPSYKFNDNLEYKFLFSVNRGVGVRRTQISSKINLQGIEGRGWANFANNELTTQLISQTLNYNKQLSSALYLNAVIGYEYQKFDNKGVGLSAQDFTTDLLPYTNIFQNSTTSSRSVYSFADPLTELQSFFGRANFNYKDRFLLTATLRADGSSKFGKNNKYGYFPSFAGAWNITNEEFMKNGFFNNLKLRLGWGKTGNQEFPAGSAQERYAFGQQSLFLVNVANPNLKWETSTTVNAGIDFSILGDRIFGSVDYFNKNTTDLLFNFDAIQPAPATKYWINLNGNVINSGLEVALNGALVKSRNITWNLGVNASFLKNELQNYNGPTILTGALHGQGISGATAQRLANGHPLNAFYLRKFLGIDKATGQGLYADNGNTLFYIGNPNPSTLLGISTDFSYKKLSVVVNMNGAFGHQIYNNTLNTVIPIGNLGSRNIAASLIGGPVQESISNAIKSSTRYLESGNYLKLTNATVSYNVGDLGKTIKNASFFLTGQNLFIITKFSGFDPEVNTDKQVNGVPSFGIEYSPYPTARSFLFGINFSL